MRPPTSFACRLPVVVLALLPLGCSGGGGGGGGGSNPPGGNVFQESEPNNSVDDADVVGDLMPAAEYMIAGNITEVGGLDDFDVFEFMTTAPTTLDFTLTPDDPATDVMLWLAEDDGDVVEMFDGTTTGAETDSYALDPATLAEFNLVVLCIGPTTDYELEVDGLVPTPNPAASAPPAGDPLLEAGLDWRGLAAAVRARKRRAGEQAIEPVILSRTRLFQFDGATGDIRLLEAVLQVEPRAARR